MVLPRNLKVLLTDLYSKLDEHNIPCEYEVKMVSKGVYEVMLSSSIGCSEYTLLSEYNTLPFSNQCKVDIDMWKDKLVKLEKSRW